MHLEMTMKIHGNLTGSNKGKLHLIRKAGGKTLTFS